MSESKSILVTGGAGFIGSHTVDRLLAEGVRVRVLDDFSNGHLDNLPSNASDLEVVRGSVSDRDVVEGAMRDVDAVIHLAAQVSVAASFDDPVHSAQTNIIGFLNVALAAAAHGVRKVVFASSAAVYGAPQSVPIAEDHPLAPISPYGLEKRVMEDYAALLGPRLGVSFTALRYFNVYGPRQDPNSPYSGVISIFMEKVGRGNPIEIHGDGSQTRDFVYVEDVAGANVAALETEFGGAINVCCGVESTLMDLVASIEQAVQQTSSKHFTLSRVGDIHRSCGDPKLAHRLRLMPRLAPLSDGLRLLGNSVFPTG